MDRVSDMVDQVARAIVVAGVRMMADEGITSCVANSRTLAEAQARAAIEAMPVPGTHRTGGHFERTGTGRGNRKWIPRP